LGNVAVLGKLERVEKLKELAKICMKLNQWWIAVDGCTRV
jgi:hypothetical protein